MYPNNSSGQCVCQSGYTQTSTDQFGRRVCTQTAPAADTAPPAISNIQVTNITTSSATITWATDEVSNSTVKYDTDPGILFPQRVDLADSVTNHSVNLSNLTAGTIYYYFVLSIDPSNNHAYSANQTFTTSAAPTATTTAAVLDSLNGLLMKIREFLRR